MSTRAGRGIFISHHYAEGSEMARRLYDLLVGHYGEGRVLTDVARARPGINPAEAIDDALNECGVLLVVTGPSGQTAAGQRGERTHDGREEHLRLEVDAALRRDVGIIPVLVDGAVKPGRAGLATALGPAADRRTLVVGEQTFQEDTARLLAALDRLLAAPPVPRADWRAPSPPAARQRYSDLLATLPYGEDPLSVGPWIDTSSDGRHLATATGLDHTVRLWNVEGADGRSLEHEGLVANLRFNPDGRRLFTADAKTVRVWDVETATQVGQLQHDHGVYIAEVSPDGRRLATVSGGDLWIWDVASNTQISRLGLDRQVTMVRFSPDGRQLATGGFFASAIGVWDVETGTQVTQITHDIFGVLDLQFDPDGRRLAAGDYLGVARILELPTGNELIKVAHQHPKLWPSDINAVRFSPDGSSLATSSEEGTARIWDTDTGAERARLDHGRGVGLLAFSPDGRWLGTETAHHDARVWETATGAERARLVHRGWVTDLRWVTDHPLSPESEVLLVTDLRGTSLSDSTGMRHEGSAQVWAI